MKNIPSDLFLLTTNLSQLKNKERIKTIFTNGVSEIFNCEPIKWHDKEINKNVDYIPVCTRNKTFGYIEISNKLLSENNEMFPYLQNAVQLLAIMLERNEQEKALEDYQKKLKGIIYEQTKSLIEKHDALNEANEELAVSNEELIETNRSLLESNALLVDEIEKKEAFEKKLSDSNRFFNQATDMFCIAGFDGYFKVMNPAWKKVLGWSIDEMLAKPWIEFVHPDDVSATGNIKTNIVDGEEVYSFENRYLCKNGEYKWLSWNSYPQPEENIMFGVARDVTNIKESEKNLKQIEWMLDSRSRDIDAGIEQPNYGDLTQYNKNGLIFNSIDKNVLSDITSDYLSLLETSSAIYEKNGDYAMGIFSSGWCRFMDDASRKLCNTKSNTKALKSGKWLCHESCWTDVSKKVIEKGEVVDIKCNGGLNLYAEPIFASNKVVGVINFGYGDPPTNETELKELAEKYQVDYTELSALSKAYETRPPFIIELAKKRLKYSARQIGTLIERKQAEQKLIESEAKFRSIIQSSPNGIYIYELNSKGQLIFSGANPSADRIIRIDHEMLIGKTIEKAFPNLANTFVPDLFAKIAKGETPSTDFEIEYSDENASGFYEVTVFQTIENAVAVEFCDISERKRSEEQLRTLTMAINQSPNSVVITNKMGVIEYINPVIEKLSGYKKDELLGQNPRIFASGKTTKEEYKVLWNTISSGNIWQGEFQNKKKNGELFWESATISPVFNSNGEITHYLAVREDVTAEKKMTQELIKAKERAEESDRLKSSFLANMSHEIRTPMNSIMGFASLLPEEESKELMCQYANIIVSNSEQLVHIIDDIVLYSRLQTRLLQNIPSEFSVCDLIADVKQSFNLPEFNQKAIELNIQNETGKVCMVKTDYDKLRQIFTNLVSNAFKYTNTGSITLGMAFRDKQLCFFVKDTGIGIPDNEKEKVFERFYRGSNVNTGAIGGTGLGLSIVKELVELLGGKIWVESNPDGKLEGQGSTFWFNLSSNK